MKNHKLIISFGILGAVFAAMVFMAVTSKAATATDIKNPYDSDKLSVNDIVATYHNNMNEAFNRYIKLMMTNLQKNPDDPNGKAFHDDGTPFTVAECLDPANANNYSTFCVAVNVLGGNTANCTPTETPGTTPKELSDDMKMLCSLDPNALAPKGYFNYVAALQNKSKQIFDTEKDKSNPEKYLDSITAVKNIVSRNKIIDEELSTAKKTIDQTLSAYDQLRMAWPIHLKYVEIYEQLEKYRDKIVEIRHATDLYPSKFIDLTTTSCT